MASSSVWEHTDVNNFNLNSSMKSIVISRRDATSYGSALMLSTEGEILALGENSNGCLGLDSNTTREPLKIQGLSLVSGVSLCNGFGDAVAFTREGKLYHWGANVHGNTSKKPVLLKNLPNIIDARCVQGHYLALTRDGKVYQWRGTKTQENRLSSLSTSPTVVELKEAIVGIACGPYHALAVTRHGEVYSFGVKYEKPNNYSSGSFSKQPVTKIPLPRETVVKIACGSTYSLALTESGRVYTWGYSDYYLGDDGGQMQWSDKPFQVGGNFGRFVDICTNGWYTNAVLTDAGAVYMWGRNGIGNAVQKFTSTQQTKMQQVFSNICPSNCSWTRKDRYSVIHEGPALLVMEMASTFNIEDFSDLTLLVGKKAIHVHKYILRLRSKFFQTWLQEHWTDRNKRQLELTCYDYDVYLSYLWFLYSGEIKTSPEHILDLWDLAVAYGEETLKSGCENLISVNMTMKTLLHFKSMTKRHSLSDIKNENSKSLEEKINEIKADYESRCQTLKEEYLSALKKLKNEVKVTQIEDTSQLARLSEILESENLKTEQLAVSSKLELTVAKLKEDLTKLKKKYEELETENSQLRKLEEDHLKLEIACSKLKDDNTILQQAFKILGNDNTNSELETVDEKKDEEVDTENPETVTLETNGINTNTETLESRIKEGVKVEKIDSKTVEIHRKRKRSHGKDTKIDKHYRNLRMRNET